MIAPEISVIIPAYNEAGVIRQTVQAVAQEFQAHGMTCEILVVDDGSTDQTVECVRTLNLTWPLLRLLTTAHRGKGAAVKHGMLAAQGRYRVFLDADHSTHIREFWPCLPWLRDGYEVVIGSRKMSGATIQIRQPLVRELMGKVFTRLTNLILGIQVTDITCGFKCFHAEAARHLFGQQHIDGWGFDAELLFLAHWFGYRVKELPVIWQDDASTKVRLLRDAWGSFMEFLRIRIAAWQGRYHRQVFTSARYEDAHAVTGARS